MLLTLALLLGANEVVPPPNGAPKTHLDYHRPVACIPLAPTKSVPSGEFRVQCDGVQKKCFAAPTRVLVDGVEGTEPLQRVIEYCGSAYDETMRGIRENWPIEEAIAEAPPGWFRDERGRVMQVNFDLGRRVYFGGAWAPYYRPDSPPNAVAPGGSGTGFIPGRARVEFGGVATTLSENGRHMHRFHFLEATGWLGPDPINHRFEASVIRYETSSRRQRAPLWLTTFIGEPRRFDIPLNIGWAAEAGRFEALGGRTFITFAELDATLDLWNSEDLDSFIRVRAGPALEMDVEGKGAYLRPAVALEGDFTLDRDGFHHFTASAVGEKLIFEPADPGRGVSPQRLRLKAGYEVILVAINDYPLTLVLDARANWRDDVPRLKGWEFSGNVGLRFSFWAPARHHSTQISERPTFSPPPPREAPPPANAPLPAETSAPLTTPEEEVISDTERLIRAAKKKLEERRAPSP